MASRMLGEREQGPEEPPSRPSCTRDDQAGAHHQRPARTCWLLVPPPLLSSDSDAGVSGSAFLAT